MKYVNTEIIEYYPGDEDKIVKLLHESTIPLIIRIHGFPDTFDLDFFMKYHESDSTYYKYKEGKFTDFAHDKFTNIIKEIKANKSVRIFGEAVTSELDNQVKQAIPIWQKIPVRPRYYEPVLGNVLYFFGAKGAKTGIHYDRELNSNLHICLHGKKRVLLFTVDANKYLYKVPFISDSLIDFGKPIAECERLYPRLEQAVCYEVILTPGDMLFMPKCCWHYMDYIEPNACATLPFYPKKVDQFLGMLIGLFYLGFSEQTLSLNKTPLYKAFANRYAKSDGAVKTLLKGIEVLAFALLFPPCVLAFIYRFKVKGGKLY